MGVAKYVSRGRTLWCVDTWLDLGGKPKRFRKKGIPTREQARALEAKVRAEAFEGKFFDKQEQPTITVTELWDLYQPVSERNRSHATEAGRIKHLVRHLGDKRAAELTVVEVDRYRAARGAEKTQRGGPPSDATLDREVELLKRILNYAVTSRKLAANPIGRARLLRTPNVRSTIIEPDAFDALASAADRHLRPILVLAYHTGMRLREILGLGWSQVDTDGRVIRLQAIDTKTKRARILPLTQRVVDELGDLEQVAPHVFVNPRTGKPWSDIRRKFGRACAAASLTGVWFHDLRRSHITLARRAGVPESVVMKLSGHKTRSVFDRYNIIEPQDLREGIARFERAVTPEDLGQDLDTEEKAENRKPKAPPGSSDEA